MVDNSHKVYDFSSPSPPSLKKLASREIALILWRRQIQLQVTENGTLREYQTRKETSWSQCLLKEIPSTTIPIIKVYVDQLEFSISIWLSYYSRKGVFRLDVLNHFTDFVLDYDGSIRYGKTAKRIMICNGISNVVKFKMACQHCLEDDILRIWPEVASFITANEISFQDQPVLYYWVDRLKNQSSEFVLDSYTSSIEELVLEELYGNDCFDDSEWPSVEYFLNRLSSQKKMEHITANLLSAPEDSYDMKIFFFRYILLTLNEKQLKELVNKETVKFFPTIPIFSAKYIRIWKYIRNEITTEGFCRIISSFLEVQNNFFSQKYFSSEWRKIWIRSPDHWKEAAIRQVLLFVDTSFFARKEWDIVDAVRDNYNLSFLLTILSDTRSKDRKEFWNKHWENLVYDIRPDELRVLVNLCFDDDENLIGVFKKYVMANRRRKIYSRVKKLFEQGYLEKLEEFLTFWCPNKETAKEMRLKLLQDDDFTISTSLFREASLLSKFIDDAYEDEHLATEFKNKLLANADFNVIKSLKKCINNFEFCNVMKFIDTFTPSDEITVQIKKSKILPVLKLKLMKPYRYDESYKNFKDLENFVGWLLDSDEEIVEFKRTLDMDTIIQGSIKNRAEIYRINIIDFEFFDNPLHPERLVNSGLKLFLKWYFVTPEAVEDFDKKYAHDPMFNMLL